MIGERSPIETLVVYGICFTMGAIAVLGSQAWTKFVINRTIKSATKQAADSSV